MRWLSRGLFEALVRFIGLAGDGMALRAALYEFHYQPVANAFTKPGSTDELAVLSVP
jgi:hypothetical protein